MTKEIAENQNKNLIYKMSENEKIKEMAEAREAYLRDQRSAFSYYREQGIEEGRQESLEEVLDLMRKMGASENLIQATLDLKKKNKG